MEALTLTEAMRLLRGVFPDAEYLTINVQITYSPIIAGVPLWQIYHAKYGHGKESPSFEEAIESIKIISDTPSRHRDVVVK